MNKRSARYASRLRVALGLMLCATSASAASAKAAPSADWSSVQALPAQTRLRIVTDTNIQTCFLDSVSNDRIACSSKPTHSGSHYEFAREKVKNIRLSGHFSSTAAIVTAASFTGAGAAIGATQDKGITNSAKPVAVGAAGGLGVGVVVGLIVGHTYGGTRGSIVYNRP